MTTRPLRQFDATLKVQVAKMIRDEGLSAMQVFRDHALAETAVRRWLAQYDAEQAGHPEKA